MKLSYLAGYSVIPSHSANSVHIMKMSDAYSKQDVDLTLFIAGDKTVSNETIFDWYQVFNYFKIVKHTFPKGKLYTLWFLAFKLPFQAKFAGVDLVHTRNIASAWGAAYIFGLDTILELHDTPEINAKTSRMLAHLISCKRLKFVICITHALADAARTTVGRNCPIYVLPDGVSQKNLESYGSKESLRFSLGIGNKFTCVYTGNLYRGKGVELIVEISKLLPDILFLIVGGNEREVKEFSSKYEFSDNFLLVGFQDQEKTVKYQQAADILLIPNQAISMSGGLKGRDIAAFTSPLKMFEYMATGIPILSSCLPVLKEILTDNHNAILLPYNKVKDWVDAIEYLKANPEIGVTLGIQAKKDVQNYTWEKRAEKILKLYASC